MMDLYTAEGLWQHRRTVAERQGRECVLRGSAPARVRRDMTESGVGPSRWRRNLRLVIAHG